MLKDSMEITNGNITDPSTTSWTVGDLTRTTNYTVKFFARKSVFEGPAAEKEVRTKYKGKKKMCAISCFLDFRIYMTLVLSDLQNNLPQAPQY